MSVTTEQRVQAEAERQKQADVAQTLINEVRRLGTEQNRAEQKRTDQSRPEQKRTDQSRTEQHSTAQHRTEQNNNLQETRRLMAERVVSPPVSPRATQASQQPPPVQFFWQDAGSSAHEWESLPCSQGTRTRGETGVSSCLHVCQWRTSNSAE